MNNSKALKKYIADHKEWFQAGLITMEELLNAQRKVNRLQSFTSYR